MSVSLIASFGLGWLLAAAPSQAGRIAPCTPDSADWKAAQEELSAFDARLEALPEDGEVEEARTGIQLLVRHRCFGSARAEEHRESPANPEPAWDYFASASPAGQEKVAGMDHSWKEFVSSAARK